MVDKSEPGTIFAIVHRCGGELQVDNSFGTESGEPRPLLALRSRAN